MSIRYSLSILPVLLVTSTLVGHAPAVSADGPVYACASRYFGFMRLVKKPKCRRRERLVTFPAASGNGGGEGNAELLGRIAELESQNAELSTRIEDLQGNHQDDYSAFTDRLDGLLQADATLRADVDALEAANATLTAQVEGSTGGVQPIAPDKIACISENSTATDLIFEGCNVHVRNSGGATHSKDVHPVDGTRGTGNLIIGYDEDLTGIVDRSGSHNLVIGSGHSYSSYAGFVAGHINSVTAPNASVTGGSENTASGSNASVSGGYRNEAIHSFSSVSGGMNNIASGKWASVSGGNTNSASGKSASVSGGTQNEARADQASIKGGSFNVAEHLNSTILGGIGKITSNDDDSIP